MAGRMIQGISSLKHYFQPECRKHHGAEPLSAIKEKTKDSYWSSFQQHFNIVFNSILLEKLDVHGMSRYTLDIVEAGWLGLESAGE